MHQLHATAPAASTENTPAPADSSIFDNHLYLHGGVEPATVTTLMQKLREVDVHLCTERLARGSAHTPIWLHVKSYGGAVHDAFALADCIMSCTTPVHSLVEGYACSAATIVSAACHVRCIQPSAYLLVHQFSSVTWGTYEQFKDDMKLQDMLIEQMVDFYTLHSAMKKKQVRAILKRDTWMNADEAVQYGLVDEVIG